MNLNVLVNTYKPVYPEPYNWETTLEFIQSDPIEKRILDRLVEDLKTHGGFREPVSLGLADLDDNEDVPAVVDGTHRVCAYIVAGVETVEVNVINYDEDESPSDYEGLNACLSTEIVLVDSVDEDGFDDFFNLLRSIPVNDELWLVSSVASMGDTNMSFIWDVEDVYGADRNLITETVKTLLTEYSLMVNVASIETVVETFDD